MGGQEGSRKAPGRGDRQWEARGKAALSAVSAQREVQWEATSRKSRPTARLHASAGPKLTAEPEPPPASSDTVCVQRMFK